MSQHGNRTNDYVVVDFDDVTAKGLKPLTDELKKAGSPVDYVEATNRKSKKDGLFTKKAKLVFENGQAVTLFVGDQGDIYQMTLNGKKQPVPNARNHKQLAKGINSMLKKNQAAFDKSQLRKAKKPKATADKKPVSRSLKIRAQEARDHISSLSEEQAKLNTALSDVKGQRSQVEADNLKLQQELDSEKAETKQLEEQLESLQQGASA